MNPDMFKLAREARGLTQAQLAEASGVAQGTISKLELGAKDVSSETLRQIAQALQYPPSFFYQADEYRGLGISVIFYRKRASTLQKHLKRLQAEINIRRMHAKALLRDASFEAPHDIERIDITEFHGTPEDIAAMVRASWSLPAGPVPNLISAIENAGGIVFRFPFGTKDIDAISQWPADSPPLFFVNASAPADRARFSLAHELGHMVMHETASATMEDEANRFAAAFLMPARDIRHQLHGIDLARAAALKPVWRVSMKALIKRANDLECMSPARYVSWMKRMSQLGYTSSEPYPIQAEQPQLASRLVEAYLQQGGLSWDDIASLLNLLRDEAQQLYGGHGGLRLAV